MRPRNVAPWAIALLLGLAACQPDADRDGLPDADEAVWGTDVNVADTDGDGLRDGSEVAAGLSPTDPDSDDDGSATTPRTPISTG